MSNNGSQSDKSEPILLNNKSNSNSDFSESKKYQYLFKVILIGDTGCGKTSIINRYINNTYSNKYICTIGVDFMMKSIDIENTTIKLQIWDTAGMERYRQITTSYYRGANTALIVFDLSDHKTFENVNKWINQYYEYSNPLMPKYIVLVGNKSDKESEVEVKRDEVEELLKINSDFVYFETSAKSGDNIKELFDNIGRRIYEDFKTSGYDLKEKRNSGSYKSLDTNSSPRAIKTKKYCKC